MLKKFIVALAVAAFSVGFGSGCEANTPPPPQGSCFSDEQFKSLSETAYALGASVKNKTFDTAKIIAETISKEFAVFFWRGYFSR